MGFPLGLNVDIISAIIDIVGENEDINLLKELALVSHFFLQICTKHLFSTVELHDGKLADDKRNLRYLLQNAKLLEKLHLSARHDCCLMGLLRLSAHTIKVLDLAVPLYDYTLHLSLAGLCEELEAMTGHNVLEALSFEFHVDGNETEEFIGSIIQKVEKILVEPGWCALTQISFNISIACCMMPKKEIIAELLETLQSLPDKYLSHILKLEAVAFNYSAYADTSKCVYKPRHHLL